MKKFRIKDLKEALNKKGYKLVKESLESIEENVMDAEDIGFEVERLHNIIMKMVEKGAQSNMQALGRLNSELKSLSDKIDRLVNSQTYEPQDPQSPEARDRAKRMANKDDGM